MKRLRLLSTELGRPLLRNSLYFSLLAGKLDRRAVRSGLHPPPDSLQCPKNIQRTAGIGRFSRRMAQISTTTCVGERCWRIFPARQGQNSLVGRTAVQVREQTCSKSSRILCVWQPVPSEGKRSQSQVNGCLLGGSEGFMR